MTRKTSPVRARTRVLRVGKTGLVLCSVLVFGLTCFSWAQYRDLSNGISRSNALSGAKASTGGATNILIMGLDSRLDENGNPLPANIYAALHAGDQQSGGYNSNVLMLLHVPAGGGRATSMSIPRDDYVDLPGSPDGVAKGKIKQAYGFGFDQEHKALAAQGVTAKATLEQQSRDAGRKAEIAAVSQLLGGVPVDHFVEVTLAAFYEIAQVVQPITVCVKEATQDSYSGADLHAGYQQINAAQAVAFVRQRRDNVHPSLNFTDLDRERRQQAFIASLAHQLGQAGTFTDPGKLEAILNVAKQNTAVDSGLDLLSFAQQASDLTSGNIDFVTLPIAGFGKDPGGEDVNLVNVAQIQAVVHQLLNPGAAAPSPSSTSAAPPPASPIRDSVDVVNANGRSGLAAAMRQTLTARGITVSSIRNSAAKTHSSVVYYRQDRAAASTLAATLGGLTVEHASDVPDGRLRLVLGTGFSGPAAPASAAPASAAPATSTDSGSGLNALSGGGIPCVK